VFWGGKIDVIFYDMTTLYFESGDEDDFRKTGFSKDGKHQCPQIFLGLLVGQGGNPIGYELFEGNIFEGNTFIPVLQHMEHRFNLGKPVVIADSGLLSKKNISAMEDNGYQYILGARPKNETDAIKQKILAFDLKDGDIRVIKKNRDNTFDYIENGQADGKGFPQQEAGTGTVDQTIEQRKTD
jgi:transposase